MKVWVYCPRLNLLHISNLIQGIGGERRKGGNMRNKQNLKITILLGSIILQHSQMLSNLGSTNLLPLSFICHACKSSNVGSTNFLPMSLICHACKSSNGFAYHMQHLRKSLLCSLSSTTKCLPSCSFLLPPTVPFHLQKVIS